MNITIAESNPDTGLVTQQKTSFSPDVQARTNKMQMITMSIASDRAQRLPDGIIDTTCTHVVNILHVVSVSPHLQAPFPSNEQLVP